MLKELIKNRRIHDVDDIEIDWLEKINKHVDFIKSKFPDIQKIWLSGSRINGKWRDNSPEFTSKYNTWRSKHKLKVKEGVSDWDYLTWPSHRGFFETEFGVIDLILINRERENGRVLIYDKRKLY